MASSGPDSDRILAGLGWRLFAALCLATMGALIKLAEARGVRLGEAMFFRQAAALPLVLAVIAAGPGLRSVATQQIGAHLRRTAVGLMGMVCTFGSVTLLPLAEATTFQFTAPIFATILGALVLREPTGWHRWGAVLAGFAGVLVLARPGGNDFPIVGAAVGLGAAFFIALIAILLRQIGRSESAPTTVFWFSILSLPPLAIAYALQAQPHDARTWAMMIAIGLVGGAGQLGLTTALRHAPVSLVVPMDYSGLVWATLYGWLFFGTLPGPLTWIGAPVIIASGLYIVHRERVVRGRARRINPA